MVEGFIQNAPPCSIQDIFGLELPNAHHIIPAQPLREGNDGIALGPASHEGIHSVAAQGDVIRIRKLHIRAHQNIELLTLPMAKARGFLVLRPQPQMVRGLTRSPQAFWFGCVPPYLS